MDTKQVMAEYGIKPLPADTVEAMAYVPFQPYMPELCKPVLGFENVTIFRDLLKPFYGSACGGDRDE